MKNSYLEIDNLTLDKLPEILQKSLTTWITTYNDMQKGVEHLEWDMDFCEVQSDINVAEVNGDITSDLAWELRIKYLGLERNYG